MQSLRRNVSRNVSRRGVLLGTRSLRSWRQRSEALFFAETKNIADGKLYNQKNGATDYLTVGGVAGSYTFQAPNTAPYIAADTDYIWFKQILHTQRTTTTAELIGYDFTRTIIKYADADPYTIEAIMILSEDYDTQKMRNDFHLSIWWDNTLSEYGNVKGNRGVGKNTWTAESVFSAAYEAVYNAFAVKPSAEDAVIQQTMLNALVDGGYFAKAELLDVFSAHNEAAGLFNWKAPAGTHNPAGVNSPVFEQYGGFKGNSAGGKCIRLNFVPSTDATLAIRNSTCVIIGIGDNVAEAALDFGGTNAVGYNFIQSRSASNQALFSDNDAANAAVTANSNSKCHFAHSRTGSPGFDSYINTTKTAKTASSVALINKELYACGFNSNGTIQANNKTLRYVFMFSGLLEAEVLAVIGIMEAYLDNYGKGLIA